MIPDLQHAIVGTQSTHRVDHIPDIGVLVFTDRDVHAYDSEAHVPQRYGCKDVDWVAQIIRSIGVEAKMLYGGLQHWADAREAA